MRYLKYVLSSSVFISSLLIAGTVGIIQAQAAVCSISVDTVIDQAYVDSNSCTSIDIEGNVSTTWLGTVNLGGGVVTVKSGNVMTMGSASVLSLGVMDDFVIEANATATHVVGDLNGLKITARNITVTGAISALGKGCQAAGPFGDDGYGVNVATGLCEYRVGGYGRGGGAGGSGGGGGSHAGVGGGGGSSAAGGTMVYGNSIFPNSFGSGGGTGYFVTAFGGAGGGIIQVTSTGTLTINGTIGAEGENGGYDGGWNGGGGGAGGSVLVHAGTLAGTGRISVAGGAGGAGGGGGGAGRVAVYYGALSTFSLLNISASRGLGGVGGAFGDGAAGGRGATFFLNRYVDDGAGTAMVSETFDFPEGGDYTRDAFTFLPGVSLGCSAAETLTVSSTAWLALSDIVWTCPSAITTVTLGSDAGISTTNTTLTFSSATSVQLVAPAWTNVMTTFTISRSGSRSVWDISSDLTLQGLLFSMQDAGLLEPNGGFLTIPRTIALTMVNSIIQANVSSTSLTTLSIDSGSSINASSRGCPRSIGAYHGAGPSVVSGICGVSVGGYGRGGGSSGYGGSGAAHVGAGGNTSGILGNTSVYGSSTYPTMFGSSGGGGYYINSAPGGGAGGVVHLTVIGALTVDGSIKADGGNGVYGGSYTGGGGGSGGSVNLILGSLAGSGSITANGGAGADGGSGGGGGSGGRIALRYSGLSFVGTSSTNAGAAGVGGAAAGAAGSLYTLQLNTSPAVPVSLGPTALINEATTGTNNPIFRFTLSDPDVTDLVAYRIQIDDSSDFSSPVVDYTSAAAAQGVTSFQVGQAQGAGLYAVGTNGQVLSNASYYWRVKAIDQNNAESSYAAAHAGGIAFLIDATPRYLSFLHATESGLESVTATSVRIVLDTAHFEAVTVNYAVTAGTADGGGVDYTVTSSVATIAAGQTSTTIPLTIVDDAISEASESFTVTLSSPVFAIIGSNTSTVYTITDDETASIVVSSAGLSLREGAAAAYTVLLSTAPTSPVEILLSVDGAATLSASTLTFTASNYSTPQTVTVMSTNDSIVTGSRTLSITQTVSTTANGYSAMTLASIPVSITEDDVAGGGAAGSGGGGALKSIADLLSPITQVPVIHEKVDTPPPQITTPAPEPVDHRGEFTGIVLLNPSDVLSLVKATQSSRDFERESRSLELVLHDVKEFSVQTTGAERIALSNFITYGISERTVLLGEGERRAVVRDALQTMQIGNIAPSDLERLTRGMIPHFRNLKAENLQLPRVRQTFRTLYGHDPNFQNSEENLAWNALMYRIRFPRDLEAEREGIREFRRVFGRAPQNPFQWATVRVLGYVR